MHLAVCDDHLVDRKQMERLLGRESDRRIHTTGVLYIDSFGSQESQKKATSGTKDNKGRSPE